MRIVYIHQYFLTPEEGGATRSYYLAKGLVEKGIDVELITAHNKSFYDLKIIDGIKVHYLPVSYDQSYGFLRRIFAFLFFVHGARKWIKKIPRADFLYISSTPLTTGLIGLWAKRKFALPYLFEVRDLWPDAPIQVGAIRNPLLKKLLYGLEKRIYKHALKVIALSPGIAESIRKKCPGCTIHIIPNFSDTTAFYPAPKNQRIIEELKLKNTFTIAYTGAIGKVNAVEEILDLARISQEHEKDFQFVVMGKGSKIPDLLQKAKQLELRNFYYIPFGSKQEVSQLLNVADIAFISFDHLPVLKTNSPNKFFDALAAGKAILVNHKGWVYDLVKTHELGYYYNPKKPNETFRKIELLARDPKLLESMQRNSRKLSEQHFSKDKAVEHLIMVFNTKPSKGNFTGGAYTLTA
ncbi:glycosyltransferase family 4 protein [Shivajiella indica]|uniref:Glycosyltransferase family 4 protein n=1 Tax=Shivajiella indica TaxID=872115 RepID=A0ABW5BF37_9BACT